MIVFPSADLDRAVAGAIASKIRKMRGRPALCSTRIFVHQDIYQAFLDRFIKAVGKLVVGNGLEDDVTIGPLVNIQAIEKIEKMINSAKQSGARVLTGGKRHALGKTYFEPTIITESSLLCTMAREEILAPASPQYF